MYYLSTLIWRYVHFVWSDDKCLEDCFMHNITYSAYSHLSNKRGGWNKRRGGAKFAKSLNVEVGINVEGGILWKKLMHNFNKRGVEGGKNLRNQ